MAKKQGDEPKDLKDLIKVTTLNGLSFKQFERIAKNQAEVLKSSKEKVDFEERKQWWLDQIDKLYNEIDGWLKPLIKIGVVRIESENVDLSERFIGIYQAKMLKIILNEVEIGIVPRGTFILGAFGRIDLKGLYGQVERLILDSDDPDSTPFSKRKGEWKIGLQATPTSDLKKLDRDNFAFLLSKLANMI